MPSFLIEFIKKAERRKCKLKTSCRSVAPFMIKFGWTTIFHVDFEAAFSNAEMYKTSHFAYCTGLLWFHFWLSYQHKPF